MQNYDTDFFGSQVAVVVTEQPEWKPQPASRGVESQFDRFLGAMGIGVQTRPTDNQPEFERFFDVLGIHPGEQHSGPDFDVDATSRDRRDTEGAFSSRVVGLCEPSRWLTTGYA